MDYLIIKHKPNEVHSFHLLKMTCTKITYTQCTCLRKASIADFFDITNFTNELENNSIQKISHHGNRNPQKIRYKVFYTWTNSCFSKDLNVMTDVSLIRKMLHVYYLKNLWPLQKYE